MHEDSPIVPGEGQHDDYPPLALSTNPLFPNAIVRRPPNTHAKTSVKPKPAPAPTSAEEPASAPAASSSPAKAPASSEAAPAPSSAKRSHKKQAPATPTVVCASSITCSRADGQVTPQRPSTRTSRRSMAAAEAAAAQAQLEAEAAAAAAAAKEAEKPAEAMDVDE